MGAERERVDSFGRLERHHRFVQADLEVEYPTGSERHLSLDVIARDLR